MDSGDQVNASKSSVRAQRSARKRKSLLIRLSYQLWYKMKVSAKAFRSDFSIYHSIVEFVLYFFLDILWTNLYFSFNLFLIRFHFFFLLSSSLFLTFDSLNNTYSEAKIFTMWVLVQNTKYKIWKKKTFLYALKRSCSCLGWCVTIIIQSHTFDIKQQFIYN